MMRIPPRMEDASRRVHDNRMTEVSTLDESAAGVGSQHGRQRTGHRRMMARIHVAG